MAREIVYFISYDNGPIKIGKANNVKARLAGIQTGCPFKLSVLGILIGRVGTEGCIHRKFDSIRMEGEWFEREQALMRFIEQHTIEWHEGSTSSQQHLTSQIFHLKSLLSRKGERLEALAYNHLLRHFQGIVQCKMREVVYQTVIAAQELESLLHRISIEGKLNFVENSSKEIRRIIDEVAGTPWAASNRILSMDLKDDETLTNLHEISDKRIESLLGAITPKHVPFVERIKDDSIVKDLLNHQIQFKKRSVQNFRGIGA